MITFEFDLMKAYELLKPLIFFIVGMTIYSIFVFKFYRFIAKRDLIKLNLYSYNTSEHWMLKSFFAIIYYILEYIILLPIFIFFWFGVLAFLLSFLAKNQTLDTVLLVAIAVVGAVRMTSYYKEDLSRDLAKMLPFALLGVFLIDITFFDIQTSFSLIKEIPNNLDLLIYYLGFIALLEVILRIFDLLFGKHIYEESKENNIN